MADGVKISLLPGAGTPSDADVVVGVQNGSTKKFSFAGIFTWLKAKLTPGDIGAQEEVTAYGILKGDGLGGVSAAIEGEDYQGPLVPEVDYATPNQIPIVPGRYTGNPAMDGTPSPGVTALWADGGHVHPTDTTRAAAALKINGHPLTGDFDLTAADVEAQSKILVNGILKGDGAGGVTAAQAGTDYVPVGYGLGVKLGTLTPIADANSTALMTGWYATSASPVDTQNLPAGLSGDDKVGAIYAAVRGEYIYQEYYCNRRNLVYSRLRGWDTGLNDYAWTTWQVEASIDPNNPFSTEQQIAFVETGTTASRAYTVGEYFCWQGLLYRVTAAISSGAAFTPGTNCTAQTVGEALTARAPAGYGLGVMTRDIGNSLTDCNDATVTGWYDVAAGASNRPSGLSQYYQAVIYSVVRGPLYSYQEYYDFNTGKVYRRFKNTTWSAWVQI